VGETERGRGREGRERTVGRGSDGRGREGEALNKFL